jgi:DNA-binding HxlR family transcriptional regulator
MAEQSYGQFCPVAMASELLCTRWTLVILRELLAGSYRFNELRRGLPRISPALLSQRLKELEEAGIVRRVPVEGEPGAHCYEVTEAGEELRPIVEGVGRWGQRWVSSRLALERLDAQLLMWDMRRNMRIDPPPPVRKVIQFQYQDAPPKDRCWWMLAGPDSAVDLCSIDPGYDVDLYVAAELEAMTAIWMGYETVSGAKAKGRLMLTGDDKLASNMQQWLGLSPFAKEQRKVA